MNFLLSVKHCVVEEINQNEIIRKNLVLKVLSSKRLLVDHVEIIEESLNDLLHHEQQRNNYLTFPKISGVLATSYVIFIHLKQNFRFLIPSVSSVMPILYFKKLVNVKRRKSLESKLAKFTSVLDNYESAIRKNKSFLHEAQIIKTSENLLKRYDKDNKIPLSLVESIKRVIDCLYNFVKHLETHAISEKFDLVYEPFEDLQDCDLMTMKLQHQVDLKVIKDFFNVFAYVQSQVLLRFVLIAVTSVDDCKAILATKFDALTNIIQQESANISKFLDIINSVSQLQFNIQKQIDEEISMTIPKELREIRSGTIKFSAKTLAIAIQCQHLEDLVVKFAGKFENPENKEIDEILAVMKALDHEMSVSIDEHKRIAISFQKYLNLETNNENISRELLDGVEDETAKDEMKTITENYVTPHTDDFFFVDGNVSEPDETKPAAAETIEEVNSKLAKKYFKPVLAQLKERIEVIGEDMKEREKKVLKAKGIEMLDELEVSAIPSYSDDDSGSDDDRERKRKFKRNEQKFCGNREFLESKQPINIFASGVFPLPMKGLRLDEEVLE